jgi:HTH-type transcriptional regulator / antitoxin HigA
MTIRPLHTEADYKVALRRVSVLIDADPEHGTLAGDELEVLGTLVRAYESQHFPLEIPDPIEAIKFRMEQQGLAAKDLQPMIGGLNRVYEVLNRKRPLSLAMIRRLNTGLGISAECLISATA